MRFHLVNLIPSHCPESSPDQSGARAWTGSTWHHALECVRRWFPGGSGQGQPAWWRSSSLAGRAAVNSQFFCKYSVIRGIYFSFISSPQNDIWTRWNLRGPTTGERTILVFVFLERFFLGGKRCADFGLKCTCRRNQWDGLIHGLQGRGCWPARAVS